MDVAAVTGLFNSLGTSGIFLAACWYLMKRMESKESERARESHEREVKMMETITEEGKARAATESFIRVTMMRGISDCSEATRTLASAIEKLPCMALRQEDVLHIINDRRKRNDE